MIYESELYHHGILGQKWGKKNGPPYPLNGSSGSASNNKKNGSDSSSKEKKSTKGSPKKVARNMSDEELKSAVDRLQMEKKYTDLFNEQKSEGEKFIQKVLKKSGENVATQLAVWEMGTLINKWLDEDAVNPKKGQKDK